MNENITYCTNCGSALLEGGKFCASCGSEVRQRPSEHKHPDPAQTAEEYSDVSVEEKDDYAQRLGSIVCITINHGFLPLLKAKMGALQGYRIMA